MQGSVAVQLVRPPFFDLNFHRAPTPEPDDDPLPGEHPVPQQDPVPSPFPETPVKIVASTAYSAR